MRHTRVAMLVLSSSVEGRNRVTEGGDLGRSVGGRETEGHHGSVPGGAPDLGRQRKVTFLREKKVGQAAEWVRAAYLGW